MVKKSVVIVIFVVIVTAFKVKTIVVIVMVVPSSENISWVSKENSTGKISCFTSVVNESNISFVRPKDSFSNSLLRNIAKGVRIAIA